MIIKLMIVEKGLDSPPPCHTSSFFILNPLPPTLVKHHLNCFANEMLLFKTIKEFVSFILKGVCRSYRSYKYIPFTYY